MAAIELHPLDDDPGDAWGAVARVARRWLSARGVALRDAVVLVPFAALMAPARAGFAAAGGWLPRVETPLTLAASLAPPPAGAPGAPCGDLVLDRLNAAALLRQHPWGAARERDDRRGFEVVVGAVVQTAQALRQAALAVPPAGRPAFWQRVRDASPPALGPGAFEALLLRVAAEWAAQSAPAASDALFGHAPGAWVVVRLGGRDALAEAAAGASPAPALVIDLDAAGAGTTPPCRIVGDGLEDEAAATAAQVIAALDAGRVPVALVALDRVLVRRVRALLERHGVRLVDETGWTLSTTRAAAALMSRLKAAAPGAGADTRLDWLKTWPPALARPRALEALEAAWRREVDPPAAAQALWDEAQAQLAPWRARRERPLVDWLQLLADNLAQDGSRDALQADAAGTQVLAALRLEAADAAWRDAAGATRLDLAGFAAWADATLEAAQFVPQPVAADVVLTPLARAIGRPFGEVVVPAADAQHLGAVEPAPGLLPETMADALGVDTALRRRERQRLAFARLLHAPSVTLLRRQREGDEPLAPSPEVEALALAAAQRGAPWPAETAWVPAWQAVDPAPVQRPLPVAAADLPSKLSASTIDTLRTCPYRFYARAVLRLYEADELEAGLEKRDYGNWLHGVLHRFHRDRIVGADDHAALQAAADAETTERDLDAAELLPFRASFEGFAPAYLAWLAGRDAAGWRWHEGEVARQVLSPALAPVRLEGRLDRLDVAPDGALQLIDYKTGRTDLLKKKVAEPLEDTQLAVYAALEPRARSAIYLSLDDPAAPLAIEHPGVADTAAQMLGHLGAELERLRAGAALPALGEGAPCDTCEARGLCRRDHWAEPEAPS